MLLVGGTVFCKGRSCLFFLFYALCEHAYAASLQKHGDARNLINYQEIKSEVVARLFLPMRPVPPAGHGRGTDRLIWKCFWANSVLVLVPFTHQDHFTAAHCVCSAFPLEVS